MATFTESSTGPDGAAIVVTSGDAPIADTIELEGLSLNEPHTFLGCQFLDGNGDLLESGTSGTVAVKVKTKLTRRWEDPTTTSIDASAPETISWSGPTEGVQCTPSSLAGATSWRIVIYSLGS